MYLGRIQEVAESEVLFAGPNHPYTEALLSAVPSVDGEVKPRIRLEGDIPSPANPPSGCVFHTRCHRFIAGHVRGDRAAAHRGRAGAPHALPHPGRRAAPPAGRDEAVAEAAVEAGEEPPLDDVRARATTWSRSTDRDAASDLLGDGLLDPRRRRRPPPRTWRPTAPG